VIGHCGHGYIDPFVEMAILSLNLLPHCGKLYITGKSEHHLIVPPSAELDKPEHVRTVPQVITQLTLHITLYLSKAQIETKA
jgi:hypothetical protein